MPPSVVFMLFTKPEVGLADCGLARQFMLTEDKRKSGRSLQARSGAAAIRTSGGTVSSPDMIVADILDGLRTGRYFPGQRLVEPDLMQRYHVGRGSVREALQKLEAEGVVNTQLHRGALIRLLSRSEMLEVLQLVEVLGGLATRLTAEKIASDKGRETFKRAFQTLMAVEHGSDFFAIVRAREAFFEVIGRLSENRELLRVWPAAPLQIARLQVRDSFIDIEARRFEEYRRIGEAILKGDGPQAEKAMREHVSVSIRAFKKLPSEAFTVSAGLKAIRAGVSERE